MSYKVLSIVFILTILLTACAGEGLVTDVSENAVPTADVIVAPSRMTTATQTSVQTPPITVTQFVASSVPSTPSVVPPIPTDTNTLKTSTPITDDYDIFNVRIEYPKPGEAVIHFSYRINKYEIAKPHAIGPLLPSTCADLRTSIFPNLFNVPRNVSNGNGQYTYTIKSQGGCDVSSFYLAIYYQGDTGKWPSIDDIVYREQVDLPLKIARDLPAVNAQTLTIRNFAFKTTGPWAGKLTFDYALSPELSGIVGKYSFTLDGVGRILYCELRARGAIISTLEGSYEINIDLKHALPREANNINCLEKLDIYDSLTYDQLMLTFQDGTYRQGVDLGITFKKQP